MQTVNLGELRSTLKHSQSLYRQIGKSWQDLGPGASPELTFLMPLLKIPADVCSCLADQTGLHQAQVTDTSHSTVPTLKSRHLMFLQK